MARLQDAVHAQHRELHEVGGNRLLIAVAIAEDGGGVVGESEPAVDGVCDRDPGVWAATEHEWYSGPVHDRPGEPVEIGVGEVPGRVDVTERALGGDGQIARLVPDVTDIQTRNDPSDESLTEET